MRFLRMAVGVLLISGMSACGYRALDELRVAEPQGSPFTRALAGDYRELAEFEYDQYDWASVGAFSRKGLAAARGEVVLPLDPENVGVPPAVRAEVDRARSELTQLLAANGRGRVPEVASRAQVSFDCWVEQLSENHQVDHIAACRQDFYTGLAGLREALAPPPAPEPPPEPEPEPVPEVEMPLDRFQVYFDFDSSAVSPAARRIIEAAAQAAAARGDAPVVVAGHADRSGPSAYNEALSRRRAEAVRAVLAENGVAPERIRIDARGEGDPVVPTDDGVREPQNRRVVVRIEDGGA